MSAAEMPFSKEAQTGRVWTCKAGNDPCSRREPCRSCLGRRNRRKGQVKQRAAAKALGVPAPKFASQMGHEERFGGSLRTEVKAGAQVGPIVTRFLAAEAQSEGARAIGDHRPFGMCAMGDGMSDGLFICRLSSLHEVAAAIVENWGSV